MGTVSNCCCVQDVWEYVTAPIVLQLRVVRRTLAHLQASLHNLHSSSTHNESSSCEGTYLDLVTSEICRDVMQHHAACSLRSWP